MTTIYDEMKRIKETDQINTLLDVQEDLVLRTLKKLDKHTLTVAIMEHTLQAINGSPIAILNAAMVIYGLRKFTQEHDFTVDTPPVSPPEKN